jgi:putative ABC transport system permease protein
MISTQRPVSRPTRKRPLNFIDLLLKPLTLSGSLARLVLKRLQYYPGLTLLALVGVILAVGLVTSAGFFAQAVDRVIMTQELAEYSRLTKHAPFATQVHTISSERVPLSLERAEALGQNVAETLSAEVGLPVKYLDLQVDSGIITLQPYGEQPARALPRQLGQAHLMYIQNVQDQLTILEGKTLNDEASSEFLEVWLHASQAEKMGVQLGDKFELSSSQERPPLPIQVTGIWQAKDPDDPFWFSNPDEILREVLLVRRQDYLSRVEPWLPVKVRTATWHVILDETQVVPAEARQYVAGFERSEAVINKYLPEARLTAPSLSLGKFVQRQTTLTILLLGFNVPAFGFLLYFLILTSAVIAYWQRREVAVLVSRGISPFNVLNITLIEELILFIVGCPLGLGFGLLLARLMGYADSFLSFSPRPPLPVSLHGLNLPLTAMTLGVLLIARLWPAAQAIRQTIVEQEREHTRPLRGPFWYRNYLDLVLIIPTIYAYDQLASRGSLALLARERPEDLYRDPLLILVPALFILALALLTMRLFPLLMRLLDWLTNFVPWLVPHLALRQLGRQHHNYINPLLLVIVSLALGVYTLSMAASLDQWLVDRMYYKVGTDLSFEPFTDSELYSEQIGALWVPPPQEFAVLPGVTAATRVGDYVTIITLSGDRGTVKGRFLGLDRLEFPAVAWFRADFAAESVGGLMNRLASQPEGILVSQQFLAQNTLRVGDQIPLHILTDLGVGVETTFTIVGTYRYFPTVYEDQITIIGNLEYLFSFFGLPMPHRLWLRLQPQATGEPILQAIRSTGIGTLEVADARGMITESRAEMERVGVFGTLSISFLAAAIMAAVGLLTYSYASLRERLYYFGMMRAMGLRRSQVIGQVILEYTLLTTYGATAGVIIGMVTTALFVPLFRVTGEAGLPLPPLLPVIAQEEIIPLAVIFAGTMVLLELLLVGLALYRRLVTALRLGHQG